MPPLARLVSAAKGFSFRDHRGRLAAPFFAGVFMARRFTSAARLAAAKARTAGAVARAADVAAIVAELHAGGITTLSGIAVALDWRGAVGVLRRNTGPGRALP
jgi:hypothetical protein